MVSKLAFSKITEGNCRGDAVISAELAQSGTLPKRARTDKDS